ncbi:hypothetical protein K7432_006153 [Basidiobolus ranarum]|uniref:Uncharacterized protein n=1 Tax=Basidiobolus ranarum TaxID=34480 RepID=A0ABR2W217_9FUNG
MFLIIPRLLRVVTFIRGAIFPLISTHSRFSRKLTTTHKPAAVPLHTKALFLRQFQTTPLARVSGILNIDHPIVNRALRDEQITEALDSLFLILRRKGISWNPEQPPGMLTLLRLWNDSEIRPKAQQIYDWSSENQIKMDMGVIKSMFKV